MKKIVFSLMLGATLFGACKKDDDGCGMESATIITQPLDNCGVRLKLKDGEMLEPVNFQEFGIEAVEGKTVRIRYSETSGASTCMAGKMVSIEKMVE